MPVPIGYLLLQMSVPSLSWVILLPSSHEHLLGGIFRNTTYSDILLQGPHGTQGKLQTEAMSRTAAPQPPAQGGQPITASPFWVSPGLEPAPVSVPLDLRPSSPTCDPEASHR